MRTAQDKREAPAQPAPPEISFDPIGFPAQVEREARSPVDTIMTMLTTCRAWKQSKHLAVVAAYEDSLTDARVSEFCRCLGRQIGQHCEVLKQMWLINELRVPQLRAIAAGEAADSDLIIVSVHHAQSLPLEVTQWIELWLGHKRRRQMILLALFDPVYQGDSGSMQTYLAQVARKAGMKFLVHSEEIPDDG